LRTVAAILAKPRYTGRQVWNRQCREHGTADPTLAGGRLQGGQRQLPLPWVSSAKIAHPPLVSEEDFLAAQAWCAPTGRGRHDIPGLVLDGEVLGKRMAPLESSR
jgi:site-specific DNA recombinase